MTVSINTGNLQWGEAEQELVNNVRIEVKNQKINLKHHKPQQIYYSRTFLTFQFVPNRICFKFKSGPIFLLVGKNLYIWLFSFPLQSAVNLFQYNSGRMCYCVTNLLLKIYLKKTINARFFLNSNLLLSLKTINHFSASSQYLN